MKRLNIDWTELELAFERPPDELLDPVRSYLDSETGRVIMASYEANSILEAAYEEIYANRPADYQATRDDIIRSQTLCDTAHWQRQQVLDAWELENGAGERYRSIPQFASTDSYRMMEDFIETVEDARLHDRLARAIQGRKPFRRFKEVLADDREQQHYWCDFERRRRRELMLDWLKSIGVEPADKSVAQVESRPLPPVRRYLLAETLWFVRHARNLPGVTRIALVGSLATDKVYPKDTDLLVTVDDDADLAPLAALARKLGGHLQAHNLGRDVFLADPGGYYIGRTCHWKECGTGIRASCDALNCGLRKYLHDDLHNVRLSPAIVAKPPIVLWPKIVDNVTIPPDVQEQLIAPLEAEQRG